MSKSYKELEDGVLAIVKMEKGQPQWDAVCDWLNEMVGPMSLSVMKNPMYAHVYATGISGLLFLLAAKETGKISLEEFYQATVTLGSIVAGNTTKEEVETIGGVQ